jgi:hypothetical protein
MENEWSTRYPRLYVLYVGSELGFELGSELGFELGSELKKSIRPSFFIVQ